MPRGRGIYEDEDRDQLEGANEKAGDTGDDRKSSANSADRPSEDSSPTVQEPPD